MMMFLLLDFLYDVDQCRATYMCFLSSLSVLFIVHRCFLLNFTHIYKKNSKFDLFIYLSCSHEHTIQQCPYDDIYSTEGFNLHVLLCLSLFSFL
jgi:hypothetical protein